jgi:hypothetical protein
MPVLPDADKMAIVLTFPIPNNGPAGFEKSSGVLTRVKGVFENVPDVKVYGAVSLAYDDIVKTLTDGPPDERLTHDDQTLHKVWNSLKEAGMREDDILDAVNLMQNAGILFREREKEATDAEVQAPAG